MSHELIHDHDSTSVITLNWQIIPLVKKLKSIFKLIDVLQTSCCPQRDKVEQRMNFLEIECDDIR